MRLNCKDLRPSQVWNLHEPELSARETPPGSGTVLLFSSLCDPVVFLSLKAAFMLILLFVVLCVADSLPNGYSWLTSCCFWHFSLFSLPCYSVSYDYVSAGLMSQGLYCPAAVISHSSSACGFFKSLSMP